MGAAKDMQQAPTQRFKLYARIVIEFEAYVCALKKKQVVVIGITTRHVDLRMISMSYSTFLKRFIIFVLSDH